MKFDADVARESGQSLEELAEDRACDGHYDFFLAAQHAMPVIGAVGSPVTPIAVK